MITQERIDQIAKDAVEYAIRDLAQERMGLGELLSDDLPEDTPEEDQEAAMDRLEAAILLLLPEAGRDDEEEAEDEQ